MRTSTTSVNRFRIIEMATPVLMSILPERFVSSGLTRSMAMGWRAERFSMSCRAVTGWCLTRCHQSPFRKVVEIEMAGEDARLEVIQNIVVATLRDVMIEGILTSEPDGNFVWIQSRKAKPLLIKRLWLNRIKIMHLGSVVPDVFMCQTRNKTHCYRIPAMPSTNSAPER